MSTKLQSALYFLVLFFYIHLSFAQKEKENVLETQQKIIIHQGSKRVNLNRYNQHSILQNVSSRGQDSISVQIFAYDIAYKKDTLIVRPEDLNIYRYMDSINAYTESRDYPKTTTISIKIPVKEIEFIKAKKQPLSSISGGIAAASYVTLMCSPFIAMSKNPSVSDFGVALFLVSAPVLAISWSINGIWAKKRYHFNSSSHPNNRWKFE